MIINIIAHRRKKRAMFQVVDELGLNVMLMSEIQFGKSKKYIYDLSPIQNKKYVCLMADNQINKIYLSKIRFKS